MSIYCPVVDGVVATKIGWSSILECSYCGTPEDSTEDTGHYGVPTYNEDSSVFNQQVNEELI